MNFGEKVSRLAGQCGGVRFIFGGYGTAHANGGRLAQYMVTGKDGERAELHELRGFAETDIVDAFRSVHIVAAATQCTQPFFHCQVRNPEGEHLSRAQWELVADRIEAKTLRVHVCSQHKSKA